MMTDKRTLLTIAFLIGFFGNGTITARTEASAREITKDYENGDTETEFFISGFLAGFYDSLVWANAGLKKSGATPIFCVPEKLGLTVDQEIDILSRFVARIPTLADYPGGGVLLAAFKDAFPCHK